VSDVDVGETDDEEEQPPDEVSESGRVVPNIKVEAKTKRDATYFPGASAFLPLNSKLRTVYKTCLGKDAPKSAPAARTHSDYMEKGAIVDAATTEANRHKLKTLHGVSHQPAFGRLFGHSVINNCIHDFMHLFYNTVLLIFHAFQQERSTT
jgi:hypothetical protein